MPKITDWVYVDEIARKTGLSTVSVIRWAKVKGFEKKDGRWKWRRKEAYFFIHWLLVSTTGKNAPKDQI